MRCVLYLRVSTDEQATSIKDQRKVLTDYAKKHGYQIVGEFADEGISGDATKKRIAFQDMMRQSSLKKWELILCWDQDRFGRFDALEAGYWIKPMRDAGIALETVGQGRIDWSDFASRIVWSINQEAKHGFLKDLARSSLRGSIERAKTGAANGRNPYGYRKGEDGHYVFDDAEKVAAVRRVFELRLQGKGYRLIALAMNEAGINSPGGGKWSHDSVRLILERAEVYAGTVYYGRRHRGKYVTSSHGAVGTTGGNARENADPIRVENAHPAIIDAETCRRVVEVRGLKRQPMGSRPGAALAGLLKCGRCGESMYWRTHSRGYLCGKYVRGHGCSFCFIAEDRINRIIGDLIVKICGGSLDALTAAIRKKLETERRPDIEGLKASLTALDAKISKAMDRILTVNQRLVADLEARVMQMQEQRAKLANQVKEAGKKSKPADAAKIAERIWQLTSILKTCEPSIVRTKLCEIFESIRLDFEPAGETGRGVKYQFVGGVASGRNDGDFWEFSAGN